jgi:hypothetical protein
MEENCRRLRITTAV